MVSWPPPCIPDTLCDKLPRQFGKCKYLRNNYYAKLHWFYNYSSEDFRTTEAQVWVGVKIPRPRYIHPHHLLQITWQAKQAVEHSSTKFANNGIINLLFSKFKQLKMGGGQDAQATVSWPPGMKIIRAGAKIPREILTPRGQAARGYLDPWGSSCPGVKINRYTGSNWFCKRGQSFSVGKKC